MIKNISFEQQRDTMDCGVSCLIMTAVYYGKSTGRDRLRLLSDLSKEEVSLLCISKAAEAIGFETCLSHFVSFTLCSNRDPIGTARW